MWARVEAAIFDANITPAARGCRLPSTATQPVLHTVYSAGRPWPTGDPLLADTPLRHKHQSSVRPRGGRRSTATRRARWTVAVSPDATMGTYASAHMPIGPDLVLAELDLGHVSVRAVRTRVSDELRGLLAAEGTAVGDEIVEVRWGDALSGQPVLSERPTMIIIDDSLAVVFGLLPDSAVSAEAVAPDGERVACTIAPGVWLVVLPNNQLGAELYPVL